MGADDKKPDYNNFKFDKASIKDFIVSMKSHSPAEMTVFEDCEFNRSHYTSTGCNGTEFFIEDYIGQTNIDVIAEEVAQKCAMWTYREMHVCCYGNTVRVMLYGGLRASSQ